MTDERKAALSKSKRVSLSPEHKKAIAVSRTPSYSQNTREVRASMTPERAEISIRMKNSMTADRNYCCLH